jgi:amidase
MPTLPMVATPLPEANAPVADILQRGFEMLPVGMMLVAKTFDKETIYRAAAAFENGLYWKGLRVGHYLAPTFSIGTDKFLQ